MVQKKYIIIPIIVIIVILILILFGYLFLSGYFTHDSIKCLANGGAWVGYSNCGPGGCNGGYCICPKDTTKYIYRYSEPKDSEFYMCWGDDGHLVCHVKEDLPNCNDRCSGPVGCIK